MNELVKELDKCLIGICALQEIRWPGKGTVTKKNYVVLYAGHKSHNMNLENNFILENIYG